MIDDVRVWSVERSQADIQADMHQTLSGSESGLLGYWRFDDGVDSHTAWDAAGADHHGTLHGQPAHVPSSILVSHTTAEDTAVRTSITTLSLLTLAFVWFPDPSAASDKPNVLFIAIDDLNDWVGCLDGHPQALTPNIDRLANRVMFDQHFNPEQRWSLFTREQVRYTEQELPSKGTQGPRHVVRAEGRDPVVLPLNRMPSDRNPHTTEGESFDWGPLDVPDSAMGDTQITDWAIERLKKGFDGKPFFLGVGYYRPHIWLWAPARYFERFEGIHVELPPFVKDDLDDLSDAARFWALEPVTAGLHSTVVKYGQWGEAVKAYLACTTLVDHQVGRLLDALDSGRFGGNTVIVLWSDHGWHLGEKQHWGKWTGWERSTRVPLIIAPPKQHSAEFANNGSRCQRPVSLIDLYPTLTELCGVPAPDGLDGQSLVPLLREPSGATDRRVVTVFDAGNVTLRSEQWRYIRYADGAEELYDVDDDPDEWTDLSSDPHRALLLKSFRNAIPLEALKLTPEPNSDSLPKQRATRR